MSAKDEYLRWIAQRNRTEMKMPARTETVSRIKSNEERTVKGLVREDSEAYNRPATSNQSSSDSDTASTYIDRPWHADNGGSSSLVRQELLRHIAEQGIPPPLDIASKEWQSEKNATLKKRAKEATLAQSYDDLIAPLLEGASNAVGETSTDIIGHSEVGGLPIYRICCHAVAPEKHRVLIVAGVHPREWQAVLVVHKLIRSLFDDPICCGGSTRVDVLPMLNPDGFELSLAHRGWRGNGNHVDINRSFEVGWGNAGSHHGSSDDKTSQNYRGEKAESEAETRAVSQLLGDGGYSLVLDVHSAAARLYGLALDLWNPTTEETQCATVLSQLLQLPMEWIRVPLASLQSAASGRDGVVSYTVETPMPKTLPLLYTKFDFCQVEAERLECQLRSFLQCREVICRRDDEKAVGDKKQVADKVARLLAAPKVRAAA